jgi:hypothetical protein
MALKIDPKILVTVLMALRDLPGGATLNDVLAAFPQRPDRRVAHRWLAALIREGVVDVDMSAKAYRYVLRYDPFVRPEATPEPAVEAPQCDASHVSTLAATAVDVDNMDTSARSSGR